MTVGCTLLSALPLPALTLLIVMPVFGCEGTTGNGVCLCPA